MGGVLKLLGRDNRSKRCDFEVPIVPAAAVVSCLGEGVLCGDIPADNNDDVDEDGDKVDVMHEEEMRPK